MSGDFKLSATLRGHEEDVSDFDPFLHLEGVSAFGDHLLLLLDAPPLSFS